MKALQVNNLTKTYATKVNALKGVSFSVEPGEFFALLGPNGAGKSTLIGIFTSLINKTQGKVSIFGFDIDHQFEEAKACIGVVPQEFNFDIFESVKNILRNQAGYYGIPRKLVDERIEYYLKKLELWDKRHSRARFLSGGMKRRLMIARALIHEPKMLILDEPTAGVDIEIRRSMWKFLLELNNLGVTIILTTHYLEEAEHLCRHLAIIDEGKIIINSPMSEVLTQLNKERFIFYLKTPLGKLPILEGYSFWQIDAFTLEVEVPKHLGLSGLFQYLNENNMIVLSMRNKANRLEELFLQLTK